MNNHQLNIIINTLLNFGNDVKYYSTRQSRWRNNLAFLWFGNNTRLFFFTRWIFCFKRSCLLAPPNRLLTESHIKLFGLFWWCKMMCAGSTCKEHVLYFIGFVVAPSGDRSRCNYFGRYNYRFFTFLLLYASATFLEVFGRRHIVLNGWFPEVTKIVFWCTWFMFIRSFHTTRHFNWIQMGLF